MRSTSTGLWFGIIAGLLGVAVSSVIAQPKIIPPNTTGDGGPAASAQVDGPHSIALDEDGNLYLYQSSEEGNGTSWLIDVLGSIRRVDASTHRINTIAEGCNPPVQKRPRPTRCLGPINAIRVAPSGKLILAEFTYNRVRAFDPVTRRFSLIAGNGDFDPSGDGGPAILAGVRLPGGIAVDSNGNVFIGDFSGSVRRVDAKTGIIYTVAGTGQIGFAGDGGPALAAQIGSPQHLAVDRDGNIYIADDRSFRIRRVDVATGTIDTIAGNSENKFIGDGGPAKAASIGIVDDLNLDPLGNVLFSRPGRVCRIDRESGILTTIAGTGGSGFSGDGGPATNARIEPDAIAVDREGNLFIAEYLNDRIRRVDARTRVIMTVVGNGLPRRIQPPGR